LVLRTRFAPAPTGYLHLGHVVNAIYVWGVARAAGGRVILRIEDHDRQRSRPEYESAIREDLDWLGFLADEDGGRQSERGAIYEEALAGLRAKGLVYACECSRAQMSEVTSGLAADAGSGFSRIYAGTCRSKSLPERVGLGVRVPLAPSVERFDDLCHGPQEQRPFEQCGDLLARDRDGNWTYQFAATVDDLEQGVDLVIRGADMLASTGRQIQLAAMLGRDVPPASLHHPLIFRPDGGKLSKSNGDTGVRELRAAGWSAGRVLAAAAQAVGLGAGHAELAPADLAALVGPRLEAHGQPRSTAWRS